MQKVAGFLDRDHNSKRVSENENYRSEVGQEHTKVLTDSMQIGAVSLCLNIHSFECLLPRVVV